MNDAIDDTLFEFHDTRGTRLASSSKHICCDISVEARRLFHHSIAPLIADLSRCKQEGKLWVDLAFPHDDSSLFIDGHTPPFNW